MKTYVYYRVVEMNKAYDFIFGEGKGWIYVSNAHFDYHAALVHAIEHEQRTGQKTWVEVLWGDNFLDYVTEVRSGCRKLNLLDALVGYGIDNFLKCFYTHMGKAMETNMKRLSIKERIEKGSIPDQNTKCWLWTGATDRRGYARINVANKNQIASRISYEAFKGQIPEGILVCHTCDNPVCVNPGHLFLGTYKDNTTDMIKKGRKPINVYRLTPEDVKVIRERLKTGETQHSISKDYGVHSNVISNIKRGETWKNI